MYGTPHADFTIKGKVVNQENMPIPDIEIKCLVEHHGDNRHWFDTIPAVSTADRENFFEMSGGVSDSRQNGGKIYQFSPYQKSPFSSTTRA